MKKIIAFTIIFALILSCRPANVLSEGTAVTSKPKQQKTVQEAKPSYEVPAKEALVSEKRAAAPALTLSDCYKMSLVQSELIAIRADFIKITEAHFLQALSIMAPHVSFLSTDFQEEAPQGDLGSTFNSLKPARSSVRNFNATMTLFSGFKAIAGMKGSGYEKKQRTDEKIRAEQLLLVDVSNAFYLLIEKREDLKALHRIETALASRIKELRAREKLGRSRPSEVVNAKTQLYNVGASIEVSRNQEMVARELLEFLVGQSVGEISDTYEFPIPIASQDYYVAKALDRPDVKAADYAWRLSKELRLVADSGFLPQVDVAANYYTQRTGFDEGTDWDVALNVNVPIFDGGLTLGKSLEAKMTADQRYQEFHRKKREAPYDIKVSYITLVTAMAVHDRLRKSYTSAKLNYYLQRKDYERSLVSNLDVLAAIQTLDDTQRDYIHALYEAKRYYWQLRVSTGQGGTEVLDDTF